ncbi:hypothetical protein HZA43_02220 [Candidatus Peregrinibacteria bacterium]|nr:hypothetical protein [Candidatus Peregrinibacteria bacterium]
MAFPVQNNDQTVHQRKGSAAASTQLYLPVAEIKDDVVVLKNGGLRAILKTSSINFNLKSEEEQNAIIYAYQGFLNSLEYPIQIIVRSRKLDIDKYIDGVRQLGEKNVNELMRQQTLEYCEYVQKLVEYADIMEKTFYVIVPYDPFRAQNLNIFQKFFQRLQPQDSIDSIKRRHHEFNELHQRLMERVSRVRTGLEGCNLRVAQLNTQQLIELLYQLYNPLTSYNEKLAGLNQMDLK